MQSDFPISLRSFGWGGSDWLGRIRWTRTSTASQCVLAGCRPATARLVAARRCRRPQSLAWSAAECRSAPSVQLTPKASLHSALLGSDRLAHSHGVMSPEPAGPAKHLRRSRRCAIIVARRHATARPSLGVHRLWWALLAGAYGSAPYDSTSGVTMGGRQKV